MARRNSYPGGKWYNRPGQAYARTSKWPTRYYQRKIGGSMIAAMAGINTTSDDFEKREGESPYLWNARLDGTKEQRKRAQSMSRMGQQYYIMPEGAEVTTISSAGGLKIELNEQKSIRWPIWSNARITQVGLRFSLDNPEGVTNAHFVLILRDSNGDELCRAYKKLTEIYEKRDEVQWFRFIRTTSGNAILEATIVDDLDNKGEPVGFSLYVDAKGDENHDYAIHDLPNLDKALREKAYDWHRGINIPVVSQKTCSWGTFPTWLQRGYFSAWHERYSVMGVINAEGKKEIYCVKYADFDPDTSKITVLDDPSIKKLIPADKIDQRATQVRMTQAGNELYFVDGYSNLQRVNLDDWSVTDAVPDVTDIDSFGYAGGFYYFANSIIVDGTNFWRCKEDHQGKDTFDAEEQEYWEAETLDSVTAWPGASLIYFINNRIALSGFRNIPIGVDPDLQRVEPNLVILSSITSTKPQYDMYNKSIEFFYVPDASPSMSAAAPVSAFSSIGDYLLIHTTDGLVIETIKSAVEFAGIAQAVPEGSQFGVLKQEHVVEGRNMVYFYNPSMGLMRTAGSTATVISGPIDSLMQRMNDDTKANAHLCMTDDIIRFYMSGGKIGEDGKIKYDGHNTMSLVDYAAISQHRSYWFRDQNTPVMSTCIDVASNFYMAVHSEYPVMFIIDESLKDFDCAILYEYYTKYISTPDRLDHVIVRRIHVTTLQTYQSSIYIGLDYDHNNKPIVWRKFITPTVKGTFYPEDIFGDDEESGATNLDIRILTTDTRFVQIRLKQYCYDFQAEILQVGFEYANRTTL